MVGNYLFCIHRSFESADGVQMGSATPSRQELNDFLHSTMSAPNTVVPTPATESNVTATSSATSQLGGGMAQGSGHMVTAQPSVTSIGPQQPRMTRAAPAANAAAAEDVKPFIIHFKAVLEGLSIGASLLPSLKARYMVNIFESCHKCNI